MISIDDFSKVEIKVGHVLEATNKEGSDKLIRLVVDFTPAVADSSGVAMEDKRIIFTAVRGYGFTTEDFLGKQFLFVTNLEPRKMMDEVSQGMILAVDSEPDSEGKTKPVFILADNLPVGSKVR